MKYYSEILKKAFDTEKACITAEKDYFAKMDEEKARKEKLSKQRENRAKAIEELFAKRADIDKEIKVALDEFYKDYGSFHISLTSNSPLNIFDEIFNIL